ncbi:MAG TPA: Cache 3/Cache 2 fusion domain-containing protein [Spirochaetota bacterium]|nr:Cache 3/Cache 2 fusion domain-containing protein [Spirochaetota bacterium]
MKLRRYLSGIRGKVLRYILLSSIVPLVISLVALYVITHNSVLHIVEQTMTDQILYIKKMAGMQSAEADRRIAVTVDRAYRVMKAKISRYPDLRISDRTEKLSVINQDTKEKFQIALPVMMSGNTTFIRRNDFVDSIVDEIGIRDVSATVFQLHEDKLVRIATNVRDKKGRRAILTFIPKESLVYRTIVKGTPYRGRALVVGNWNITHYEPVKSGDGKVIGAVYVGIPAPKTVVFDMIRESKIGERGYMYIMNSLGQLIAHPYLKGKSIYNMKDPVTGNYTFKEMIAKKNGTMRYNFKNKDGNISKRVASFAYFEPWDWIIAGSADEDDVFGSLNIIFNIMLFLLVVFSTILVISSNVISGKLIQPLRQIIKTTVQVSNGDLTVFIPQSHYVKCAEKKNCTRIDCPAYSDRNKACWRIEGTLCDDGSIVNSKEEKMERCRDCEVYKNAIRSEVEEIIEAINNMIMTIRPIMMDIADMTMDLNRESESLAEVSKKMELESQTQAASIEETTSANEELMASIDSVANSAANQAERVEQTSAAMEELAASTRVVGENSLNSSKKAGQTVEEARNTEQVLKNTIQSINQITASSKKIMDIVAIINDISDQINLLSLNAAIEAARAGEHGKGFAVVSEEISKLADATAQSTKEIESLIRNSKNDIETGATLVNQTATAITSMIREIEDAARLVEEIALSSEEQVRGSEQVMKDVEEVSNMSSQIANATGEQKATSAEILKAVSRINESIQEVAQSSQLVADSAETIKEKSERLTQVAQIFKV